MPSLCFAFSRWVMTMPRLTDADRTHIPTFVAVVGEALEECPKADTSTQLLFDACKEISGPNFIPLGTFNRLLRAAGYKPGNRRYGYRYRGLRPKIPALHSRVYHHD
jgi:hypothetical protein